MSRANDCVEAMHWHVGICQRRGYANGLKDAQAAVATRLEEMHHEDWCCGKGCAGYHGTWVGTGEKRDCPGCTCLRSTVAAHFADLFDDLWEGT